MSPLGEKLIEFLRSDPDVMNVGDESGRPVLRVDDEGVGHRTENELDIVACRLNGRDYEVVVDDLYLTNKVVKG